MPRHRARAQLHRRSVLTLHEVGHHLLSLHRMNNVGLRLRFVYGKNLGCAFHEDEANELPFRPGSCE